MKKSEINKLSKLFDFNYVKVKPKDIKYHWSEKGIIDLYKNKVGYDWDSLLVSMLGGYNKDIDTIVISKDGYCLDGHHRVIILKDIEPNRVIDVVRFNKNYWRLNIYLIYRQIMKNIRDGT